MAPLNASQAATNVIRYSRDLTNVEWTETGTSVAALNETGVDGVANSVCTLTDDNVAAYELVNDEVAIPDDSNTHTMRVFIKKDADETRFPLVGSDLIGGTVQRHRINLNTKTGATAIMLSAGTVNSEVNHYGDWWEVLISVANNGTGNVNAQPRIVPARGNTLDTQNVSATGSVIVGNVELHLNKTIQEIRGLEPIYTEGTAVTARAISSPVFTADNPPIQIITTAPTANDRVWVI
jgi:hypothetical protein